MGEGKLWRVVGRRSRGEKYTCFVRLLNVARALRQRKQACQRAGARAYNASAEKKRRKNGRGWGKDRKEKGCRKEQRNETRISYSSLDFIIIVVLKPSPCV